MRRFATFAAAAVLAVSLASTGCSNPKEQKCKEAYGKMIEFASNMAKALGGKAAGGKDVAAEMKAKLPEAQFVAQCKELPDEAIACMDLQKAMSDKSCQEIMKKYKDKFPRPPAR
jgi:hypothetical protein